MKKRTIHHVLGTIVTTAAMVFCGASCIVSVDSEDEVAEFETPGLSEQCVPVSNERTWVQWDYLYCGTNPNCTWTNYKEGAWNKRSCKCTDTNCCKYTCTDSRVYGCGCDKHP